MNGIRADLRYAIRSFRRTPAFTAVVLATLALGIGANTAIFTVVNAVLLRELPYPQPGQLLRVQRGSSYPDMRDWIDRTTAFSAIGGFRPQTFDYGGGPEAERLPGALVTGQLLGLLGARPLAGRLIGPDDDRTGTEPIVLVSAEFWRSRLGSDPAAVGRAIVLNGSGYTIAGVLDPGFSLPGAAAHIVSPFYPAAGREAQSRGAHTLRAIVRLRDGLSVSQSQQEMDALAVRLEQQYPVSNQDVRFRLQPLADSLVGRIRPALVLLLATVGFVLLIACVNVANLVIARGAARRGELAIRAALGAAPARLARQLLTESVLLALAGGIAGLLVAHLITRAVVGLAPADIPRLDQATLDWRVLAFTALLAAATGLLFGLLPAWTAASTPLVDATRSSGRATSPSGAARSVLMVAEIAIALVLVVGAGLLLRSFATLIRQPIGFDAASLATANITFNGRQYLDVDRRSRLFDAFEEAVRQLPGVRAVALTTDLPIGGNAIFHNLTFEGRPAPPGGDPEVYYRGVNPGYFDALGIPLRRGRHFTPLDRAGAPLVAIVNEAFVRQYYPDEEPLGRRVRWVSGPGDWITIVGVVADVRGLSLDSGEVPAVHMSFRQEQMAWRTWMDVAVRTNGSPASVIPALRRELARLDAAVPLTRPGTMDRVIGASVADRRFNLYLLGGFAVLSLLLAAAGTYGVMAYAVAQRTAELGLRMALGASPANVFTLIVGRGLALAAIGVIVGTLAALALARVMSATLAGLLFEIAPTDAVTFAGAAGVLLLSAGAATWLPARRAARLDPVVALRSE